MTNNPKPNCYDCKNCMTKPHEYGINGHCAKRFDHDNHILPLNFEYDIEWEEPDGISPVFANKCPAFKIGERQKMCKDIYDIRSKIAEEMTEMFMLIEGIQDFDYENRTYFGDNPNFDLFFLNNDPIPPIMPIVNPNQVWKTLGRGQSIF